MAKQLVSPVERHVEKVVLGITAVLLIGVVAKFLITSPNQRVIDGVTVHPNTIDEQIAKTAEAVRLRIRTAEPPVVEVPEGYTEFLASLNAFKEEGLPATLPPAVSIYPEVPIIDPPEGRRGGDVRLVEVVGLPKPEVSFDRATFLRGDDDEAGTVFTHEPVNWVTVSAVFSVEEQSELQKREYGPHWKEVIFRMVELQRRTRYPDGSWAEEDWATIDPYPALRIPEAPDIPLVEDEGGIMVHRDDYRQVEEFVEELSEASTQLALIRPLLPAVENGACPGFPLVTTLRDVLLEDDEYLYPNEAPAKNPDNRYPCMQEEAKPKAEEDDLAPAERMKKEFARAELLLKRAWDLKVEDDAVKANNIAIETLQNKESTAPDRSKARRLKQRADQLQKDIKRWWKNRDPKRVVEGTENGDTPQREKLPRQQVWVHDARPGSVLGGHTYQYRMRPWILNRKAGLPRDFEDKLDAAQVFIAGPWSEPSDPVTIEKESLYFLTKAKEKNGRIGVEQYQWFEGVWVKTSKGAYGIGDAVAYEDRQKVPDPYDPEGYDNARVQFDADAVVVDIDFNRSLRLPSPKGQGIKLDTKQVCSVVFVDSAGQLQERVLPLDKSHPGKKILADRVWKAPRVKPKVRIRSRPGGGFGPEPPTRGRGRPGKPPKRPKKDGP